MNILVVDDESVAVDGLIRTLHKLLPEADIKGFRTAAEALAEAGRTSFDIAFLDISLSGENGLALAKKITGISPSTNIIFTTGYDEYARDAFSLHASGYITKPVTPDKIRRELADLRRPVAAGRAKVLKVRCFGNFEVFAGDAPLRFRYNKTREMLAYLIDRRGALCATDALCAILWENDDPEQHRSYLKNLRTDLIEVLDSVGAGSAVVRQWNRIGIVPELIDCDYYQWLSGETGAATYRGEYMSQYSWAEMTNGWLDTEYANRGSEHG